MTRAMRLHSRGPPSHTVRPRPCLPSLPAGLPGCQHVEMYKKHLLQLATGKAFARGRGEKRQKKHACVKYLLSARHLHTLSHLILRKGNLILQMRKLRLRKIKCLVHGLGAGQWWRPHLTPGLCFSIGLSPATPGH